MSNRIQILNATADDFALEIVSSAPANGSIGDHANGRLVKYGTHIYVWCNHQGIWAKFANTSDFTSLETRLSQQEDANDADVLSLEAVDTSLETRMSEEESAMLSAVASEEARASTVEGSLESEISSLIVSREEDVSYETSLQGSLITEVDSTITSLIQARISAVDSLEARASSIETSLETRLSNEEDTKDAADLSLSNRISAEESNMTQGSWSFTLDLMSANVAGLNASDSLELALSTEEGRINAILAASTADKDSFAEIVSHINAVDLSHDTQTSTEIASLAADIVSMESSLEGIDDSLELRLSNEEDAMAAADASLTTRVSSEEVAMAAGDSSLSARMGINESERLTADNSLTARAGTNELSRANADTSLDTRLSNEEDTMSAGDLSLETLLSGDSADRVSDDSSIETRISEEESAMLSAVASEETERIAADTSLEDRISIEAYERFVQDHVQINQDIIGLEQGRVWSDDFLTTDLSNEEDNFSTDKSSIETRLSIEEDAMSAGDSSVETRFSNEVSTEKSRIDDILDSADADKDTFVELVSFITEFDVDADDQLASYQLVIDSRISAEESNMPAGDLSLETELSSQIIARQSAVTSLENKHSGEISTLASSVDSLETREEARHLRVDFSNKTSFTVLQSDLPSGFTPGNGLVQVFQEVSSNTYRRLVSPMNYDPTTGEMTFNLGVTQKSGFAVFYSFAGNESTLTASTSVPGSSTGSSSSSSNPQFKITGATLTSLDTTGSGNSVITLDIEGMTADNFDTLLNYTHEAAHLTGSTRIGYARNNMSGAPLTFSYNSDYSELAITLASNRTPTLSDGNYYFFLRFGSHTSASDQIYGLYSFYFDVTTQDLITTQNVGKVINDEGYALLSPPYMAGSGTLNSYASAATFWGSSKGPEFQINLSDYLDSEATRNYIRNFPADGGRDGYFGHRTGAARFSFGSTDYYITDLGDNFPSSGDLYDELIDGALGYGGAQYYTVQSYVYNGIMYFGWHRDTSSSFSAPAPSQNSTVTFYFAPGQDKAPLTDVTDSSVSYDNYRGNVDYASAIKIVIDLSDNSYEIYRDSNVGGSLTWTLVDRCYLSNQKV